MFTQSNMWEGRGAPVCFGAVLGELDSPGEFVRWC